MAQFEPCSLCGKPSTSEMWCTRCGGAAGAVAQRVVSPEGEHEAQLVYAGEVRWGPPYYVVQIVDRAGKLVAKLDDAAVHAEWKSETMLRVVCIDSSNGQPRIEVEMSIAN